MPELPTLYQEQIHRTRYARWKEEEDRRESWGETIDRYIKAISFQTEGLGYEFSKREVDDLRGAIFNLEVMPSMRALMTAGKALSRDQVASFNCAYLTVSRPQAFDEALYILCCGTGVGFSVERQYINQLPDVPDTLYPSDTTIVVRDSKIGWASALRQLVHLLYSGVIPNWDISKVRAAGTKLKTFGGRASGPGPLVDLFQYVVDTFNAAQGRKLSSIECHGIMCKVGDVVVVGGVRRSALISLSNPSDDRMRDAKTGQWWNSHPEYALANNSAVWTEKPSMERFLEEWISLIKSKSGERGLVNREGMKAQMAKNGRRDSSYDAGLNPCSEIILRDREFCNLSEVVVRSDDTYKTLKEKVRIATILGTVQSSFTDFRYLSAQWKKNCEEERLLGVSLTGIMDHPLLSGVVRDMPHEWWGGVEVFADTPLEGALAELRQVAIDTNVKWAEKLGINPSAAITCVKPSGCRPWDGLTTTTNGVLTLEELFVNHPAEAEWALHGQTHAIQGVEAPIEMKSLTKTYANGEAAVMSVQMTYGLTVESTPNHQWAVRDRGWVATANLVPGDVLAIQPGIYRSNIEAPLAALDSLAIKMRGDAVQIAQPSHMSPDLAWLLGYLWGDGCMSPVKYRLRFCDARRSNLQKAQRIFKDLFGLTADIHPGSQGRKADCLEVASKYLWHWLIRNDVWKYWSNTLDIIPGVVRRSSNESIIAFIAGLADADAWMGIKNDIVTTMTITSAAERFAKHIQDVALTVGLVFGRSLSTVGRNKQTEGDYAKAIYLMELTPHTLPEAGRLLLKHSQRVADSSFAAPWVFDKMATRAHRLGRVKAVIPIGILPTYDIEVNENHWYYAGGVKSHNTVSQLVDAASGIHARWNKFYIRTNRASKNDPVAQFLYFQGIPCEDELIHPDTTWVFSYPMKAPEGSITREDVTAIDQLKHWLIYAEHWCEHKPSITVYVHDHEWLEVGAFVYKHFDQMSGVSFLPHTDHTYKQAPYQDIDEETYNRLVEEMPKSLDWSLLPVYEKVDSTEGMKELACSAGGCEI